MGCQRNSCIWIQRSPIYFENFRRKSKPSSPSRKDPPCEETATTALTTTTPRTQANGQKYHNRQQQNNYCHHALRTKQQLGYLVFSGAKLVEGVSYMYLLVQSAERSPSYITDRSLDFLEGWRQELVDLPASKLRCGTHSLQLSTGKMEDNSSLQARPWLRATRFNDMIGHAFGVLALPFGGKSTLTE